MIMSKQDFINKLEEAKIKINLLDYVNGDKKSLGGGKYRINPCPMCGRKDHFTLFEPNTINNKNNWWTYSSFNDCCNGGSIIDYMEQVEGKSKESIYSELLGADYKTSFDTNNFKAEIKPKEIIKANDPA